MPKDRRSKDQKRKAKLAERAKRSGGELTTPYEGAKYRAPAWVVPVEATERAVYETILLSERRLTNDQVQTAFLRLIDRLRKGQPTLLTEDEPEIAFAPGAEVDFLVWNIRRHWGTLFQAFGPVSTADLIGILRTLLYSIKAQAWHSGASLGYVHFLYGFFRRIE